VFELTPDSQTTYYKPDALTTILLLYYSESDDLNIQYMLYGTN